MLSSLIPSARLEQDAHRLGFRERDVVCSTMDSPQQMQIRGFIPQTKAREENRGSKNNFVRKRPLPE
jgi:hypothetical protein